MIIGGKGQHGTCYFDFLGYAILNDHCLTLPCARAIMLQVGLQIFQSKISLSSRHSSIVTSYGLLSECDT